MGKHELDQHPHSPGSTPADHETSSLSYESTLHDLRSDGSPLFRKVIIGAVVPAVAVPIFVLTATRRDDANSSSSLALLMTTGVMWSLAGAISGGLLALKDVVQSRLANQKPVAIPLKLLFGSKTLSLIIIAFLCFATLLALAATTLWLVLTF